MRKSRHKPQPDRRELRALYLPRANSSINTSPIFNPNAKGNFYPIPKFVSIKKETFHHNSLTNPRINFPQVSLKLAFVILCGFNGVVSWRNNRIRHVFHCQSSDAV